MKKLLRKILLGDTEISEYSTITISGDIKEHVYLSCGEFNTDISSTHWVLCLEPIVFGVWLAKGQHTIDLSSKAAYTMYFTNAAVEDFRLVKRRSVAIVTLDYFDKIEETDGTLYLLKLRKSKIYHLSFLKIFLLFYRYYRKPKLSFKKYKSLVAAYSYPRKVRVISFKQNDYHNIFPMDLLGAIPRSHHHVFGLRHTNTTLSRIIETRKIVASEVPYRYKDDIYELGKHHGGAPPSLASLPFAIQQTENFGFPVPEWADSYKEMQILKTTDLGSHMLLWGEIVNEKILKQPVGNLYHIHFLLHYHHKLKGAGYRVV